MASRAFEEVCEEALARWRVPGATAGILSGGDTRTYAFGTLDVGTGAPATADSTFRIASITKPFTATLALYVSLSAVVSFDEEIGDREPPVTVHHLLSHLGGFEGECGDLARFGDGDDALEQLAEVLASQRQLVPPDETWSYCNAGYWLLGHELAERLGTPFETAMRDWVLHPLGLARTSFGPPDATGHVDGAPLREDYPRARNPSGGLVSNVGDLLAFARYHLETPETDVLRAPVVDTPTGDYGFGFALERVGDRELWGHTGSLRGYTSLLVLEPETGFAFAALANAGGAGRALDTILDAALERELGVRREPPETTPVEPDALAELAGRYRRAELEVEVRAVPDRLELDVVEIDRVTGERTALPTLRARPIGERRFAVDGGDIDGTRFDFHPPEGEPRFIRYGSMLTERVP